MQAEGVACSRQIECKYVQLFLKTLFRVLVSILKNAVYRYIPNTCTIISYTYMHDVEQRKKARHQGYARFQIVCSECCCWYGGRVVFDWWPTHAPPLRRVLTTCRTVSKPSAIDWIETFKRWLAAGCWLAGWKRIKKEKWKLLLFKSIIK